MSMTCFSPLILSLLSLIIILCPLNSIAHSNLHNNSVHDEDHVPTKPNTGFQVTKPIDLPNTVPCKQLLLQHEFGSTTTNDDSLIAVVNYAPPSHCTTPTDFSKLIILEWKGTCKQKQAREDTLPVFGVWLGGVEILRSSPAQGRFNSSVAWTARKDITRYSSLLLKKEAQELVVSFHNPINGDRNPQSSTTGVLYHITISISFYPGTAHTPGRTVDQYSKADLILPISGDLKSKGFLWFQIANSTDRKLKEFKIPQNAYRAVLEIYVSSHHFDEFWYSNYPAEYYNSNQFADQYANGPFRDVVISLDDEAIGAIWPYPVIYGAISDNIFNPVASIRSFDLPSYDFEVTPFLGTLLDGESHNLSFSVANAVKIWYIDANLHLWLDPKSIKTKGKLVSSYNQPLHLSSMLRMKGFFGKSWVEAHRMTSSQGWVQSSHGNITTHVNRNLSYTNYMDIGFDIPHGNYNVTVQQLILSNDSVRNSINDDDINNQLSFTSMKNFSLMVKQGRVQTLEQDGSTGVETTDISTGYSDKTTYDKAAAGSQLKSTNTLEDDQQSGNSVWVINNYTWHAALQALKQSYNYYQIVDNNNKVCYTRKIGSLNATIVYDNEGVKC